jgi:hypothetical protein
VWIFEFDGCVVVQRAVSALGAVEALDVVGNGDRELDFGSRFLPIEQLDQHRSVVPSDWTISSRSDVVTSHWFRRADPSFCALRIRSTLQIEHDVAEFIADLLEN